MLNQPVYWIHDATGQTVLTPLLACLAGGLPIIVLLILAKNCRTYRRFFRRGTVANVVLTITTYPLALLPAWYFLVGLALILRR